MEFLIILFLLVLNGIFAMYEIALVSSSKARLETLVAKGNKSARGVLKQLEEPEKFYLLSKSVLHLSVLCPVLMVELPLPTTLFLCSLLFRERKPMRAIWL